MSEESKKSAIELFKEAAKDANENLGIPFLSTVFAMFGLVLLRIEESKFENFLDHIRIRLAFGNMKETASYIANNMDKKWMSDGLARGWRLGMDTIDDIARECAYLMVADYLAEKKEPDRTFRQIGDLLRDADLHLLEKVLTLSDIFESIKYRECILVAPIKDREYRGPMNPVLVWHASERRHLHFPPDAGVEAMLVRNGFATSSSTTLDLPMPPIPPPGRHGILCCFPETHMHTLWIPLRKYLEPVREAVRDWQRSDAP